MHCDSNDSDALPDQLTTAEAFDLIEQLAEINIREVTFTGGEPLRRRDIIQLVRHAVQRGVAVHLLTNGWHVTDDVARQLKEQDISVVAVKVNGMSEIHDRIARPGSYDHARQAIEILARNGIETAVHTTAYGWNIDTLPQMKDELMRMGISSWHIQSPTTGQGAMRHLRDDEMFSPARMGEVSRHASAIKSEGKIALKVANGLVCGGQKKITGRHSSSEGCDAGTRSFGVLYNGDIVGCVSLDGREHVEGNIRERTLRDIWEDEDRFLTWRDSSRGGCPNRINNI
jgi:MoaA/NifB/PqqE/SkfB family radical SAM enzyme